MNTISLLCPGVAGVSIAWMTWSVRVAACELLPVPIARCSGAVHVDVVQDLGLRIGVVRPTDSTRARSRAQRPAATGAGSSASSVVFCR